MTSETWEMMILMIIDPILHILKVSQHAYCQSKDLSEDLGDAYYMPRRNSSSKHMASKVLAATNWWQSTSNRNSRSCHKELCGLTLRQKEIEIYLGGLSPPNSLPPPKSLPCGLSKLLWLPHPGALPNVGASSLQCRPIDETIIRWLLLCALLFCCNNIAGNYLNTQDLIWAWIYLGVWHLKQLDLLAKLLKEQVGHVQSPVSNVEYCFQDNT